MVQIGNRLAIKEQDALKLAQPKATRILAKKITVATAGTPVEFPQGKVATGEIRLNTYGNTGNVYIGDGLSVVKDGVLRFKLAKDISIPYTVTKDFEVSRFWVDADTDGDVISILCEVRE